MGKSKIKHQVGVGTRYKNEMYETFEVFIFEDETQKVVSNIGKFGIDYDQEDSDTVKGEKLERKVRDIIKFRNENGERIDREFASIVAKF